MHVRSALALHRLGFGAWLAWVAKTAGFSVVRAILLGVAAASPPALSGSRSFRKQEVPNSHGTAPSPERTLSAAGIHPGPTGGSGGPRSPHIPPDHDLPVSRRHDQSYKLLFSIPLAVDQLIRHYLDAGLADELVGAAYHGLTAAKPHSEELAPGGRLPPTLAVTVYNGQARWTAPQDIAELIEPVHGWLAARQPRLRHEVLDLRERARHSLPKANVVSWIASLELDPSFHNVSRVVQRVLERYPGAEHARLREAFREWVLGAAESWGIREEVLEEVKSLKEAEMIYAGVEELKERAHREGLGRGRMEGRATLCRQARLKFGAETAEQLSRLMEGIADPERIARIGDRIIECDTGAELLARARES